MNDRVLYLPGSAAPPALDAAEVIRDGLQPTPSGIAPHVAWGPALATVTGVVS
jgi:hypothetical protein